MVLVIMSVHRESDRMSYGSSDNVCTGNLIGNLIG